MRNLRVIAFAVALVGVTSIWIFVYRVPERLTGSSSPVVVPSANLSFEEYVEENQRRIREVIGSVRFENEENPFGSEYSLDDVVRMRSPFEFLPNKSLCEEDTNTIGILLAHGLTDSPYLIQGIGRSLAENFPCAIVRGLLTPGHGTVPGDLLTVTLQDWRETFAWGIASFPDEVESKYVVGYSNGAALTLDYLQNFADSDNETLPISGAILVSPGLQSTNPNAGYGAYLKYVWPWIYKRDDRDAAKYESFPTHAAALFYELTETVRTNDQNITIPTLFIVSSDDSTTRSDAAISFYCNNVINGSKRLLLLTNKLDMALDYESCEGIVTFGPNDTVANYESFSHIGLTLPAEDPHYGFNGVYPVCLAHADFPQRLNRCLADDEQVVYAENNLQDANGQIGDAIVRRSSFNPNYLETLSEISCFINDSC